MTFRTAVAVFVGLGMATVACAEPISEEDLARNERLEAVNEQSAAAGEVDFLRDELECMSDGDLDAADLLTATTDATAAGADARTEAVAVMIDCSRLRATSGFVGVITNTFNLAIGPDIDVGRSETRCALQFVVDNADDPARVIAIGDTPDSAQVMFDAFSGCLDEESLAVFLGESGPMAYGDDPELDELYDGCAAGDQRQCDVLYFESAIDSEYQMLGASCGVPDAQTTEYCTEGLITAPDGFADLSSPGLPILVTDCENGDMLACDLLFLATPFDSDFADIGNTCAGRIVVGAVPNCRTRFPDLGEE